MITHLMFFLKSLIEVARHLLQGWEAVKSFVTVDLFVDWEAFRN
jgi:hypothetical protein